MLVSVSWVDADVMSSRLTESFILFGWTLRVSISGEGHRGWSIVGQRGVLSGATIVLVCRVVSMLAVVVVLLLLLCLCE